MGAPAKGVQHKGDQRSRRVLRQGEMQLESGCTEERQAVGEGASLRGRRSARWGTGRQGGATQSGCAWRQKLLMQGWMKQGPGGNYKEVIPGMEMSGVQGAKGTLKKGRKMGSAGCVDWPCGCWLLGGCTGVTPCPAVWAWQGDGGCMAQVPWATGEKRSHRVCCFERASHGLQSLNTEGRALGGGRCKGMTSRGIGMVLVGTAVPFVPVTSEV